MNNQLYTIVLAAMLCTLLWSERVVGQALEIAGMVLDPQGTPIPEAIVSIVSQNARGKRIYTDGQGHFIDIVPLPVDPGSFLEIYWNEELMFRQPLMRLPREGSYNTKKWADLCDSGGFLRLEPIRVGR
jgi:hypothetical protein